MAKLLRAQGQLRSELVVLHGLSENLQLRLHEALSAAAVDKAGRRAALNLMEDAVRARAETSLVNVELRRRIEDNLRSEAALEEARIKLSEAQKQFEQLQAEFDVRVRERTRELERREERLRELASLIKRSEQQERQRLARLLHDHIQQLLVAAKMRIDIVSSDLEPEQQAALAHTIGVLNDAIQATRDLSVQLTPPLLHDQGLPAALDWLASRMARQYSRKITTDFDESANPDDEENREILFQAAQEFLLNSAKHADADCIACRLRRATEWICLEVADEGKGFDASSGTGEFSFGLFQIRQRLESIGGHLTVRSAPNQGTVVTASIPAGKSGAAPASLAEDISSFDESAAEATDLVTVVVIDDHTQVRKQLIALLCRQPNIDVIAEAADGVEGLEVVLSKHPDVVVMDVNLPRMNGVEATRRILAKLPQTKIIGLSMDEAAETSQLICGAGAIAFVNKAAPPQEFVEAVRAAACTP